MEQPVKVKDQYLRAHAPWPIPKCASFTMAKKAGGYWQAKYRWQAAGWSYEARWHERTPAARLVTWPSWRLDRVKAGKGFGPDAHARCEQSLVGGEWESTRRLRYCARRFEDGQASDQDVQWLLNAHYRSV